MRVIEFLLFFTFAAAPSTIGASQPNKLQRRLPPLAGLQIDSRQVQALGGWGVAEGADETPRASPSAASSIGRTAREKRKATIQSLRKGAEERLDDIKRSLMGNIATSTRDSGSDPDEKGLLDPSAAIAALVDNVVNVLEAQIADDFNYTQWELDTAVVELGAATYLAMDVKDDVDAKDALVGQCRAEELERYYEAKVRFSNITELRKNKVEKCERRDEARMFDWKVAVDRAAGECDWNSNPYFCSAWSGLAEGYESARGAILAAANDFLEKDRACIAASEALDKALDRSQIDTETLTLDPFYRQKAKCANLEADAIVGKCQFGERLQEKCAKLDDLQRLIEDVKKGTAHHLSHRDRIKEWTAVQKVKCFLMSYDAIQMTFDWNRTTACEIDISFATQVGILDYKSAHIAALTTDDKFSCTEKAMKFSGTNWATGPELSDYVETTGYSAPVTLEPLGTAPFDFCAGVHSGFKVSAKALSARQTGVDDYIPWECVGKGLIPAESSSSRSGWIKVFEWKRDEGILIDGGRECVDTLFGTRGGFSWLQAANGNDFSVYRRLYTYALPEGWSAYDNMIVQWSSEDNVLNTDFQLYSELDHFYADQAPWQKCSYDGANIAFPGECCCRSSDQEFEPGMGGGDGGMWLPTNTAAMRHDWIEFWMPIPLDRRTTTTTTGPYNGDCRKSGHGCCPDGITTKLTSSGSNCAYYITQGGADPCPANYDLITDLTSCKAAVKATQERWSPRDGGAYRVQTDGGGFCQKCTGCGHNQITYMLNFRSDEKWANYYCIAMCDKFDGSSCPDNFVRIEDAANTPGVYSDQCCVPDHRSLEDMQVAEQSNSYSWTPPKASEPTEWCVTKCGCDLDGSKQETGAVNCVDHSHHLAEYDPDVQSTCESFDCGSVPFCSLSCGCDGGAAPADPFSVKCIDHVHHMEFDGSADTEETCGSFVCPSQDEAESPLEGSGTEDSQPSNNTTDTTAAAPDVPVGLMDGVQRESDSLSEEAKVAEVAQRVEEAEERQRRTRSAQDEQLEQLEQLAALRRAGPYP